MQNDPPKWTIGALARAAGVNVETIRFYQRRRLLSLPERPPGGFRHYGREDLARLNGIRRAQQLGFSLDEIEELLSLNEEVDKQKARGIAQTKIGLIDSRIEQLRQMRAALVELVDCCRQSAGPAPCPILRAFSQGE